MKQDKNVHKGTAVTKPIELRAKKAGAPVHGRVEKSPSAECKEVSASKEARASTAVGALAAGGICRSAPKPEIIEQIGYRLRGVYNDVLAQPIPDQFLDLLAELESGGPVGARNLSLPRSAGGKKDAK